MIKRYLKPTCPRCRLINQSNEIANLTIEDMMSVKCLNCKKTYYLRKEETYFWSYTNYYEFHNYLCKENDD